MLLLLLACSRSTPSTPDCARAAPASDSGLVAEPAPVADSPPAPCTVDAWYQDCDGDGSGRSPTTLEFSSVVACEADLPATDEPTRCTWVTVAGDCADDEPAVAPFGVELCDGRDNDCDSYVDEGFDTDGDGLADCNGLTACP